MVMYTPGDAPKPVDRNQNQGKHRHKRHSIVEEDPDATKKTTKRPVSKNIIRCMEAHCSDGDGEVRDCQIDHVIIEGSL